MTLTILQQQGRFYTRRYTDLEGYSIIGSSPGGVYPSCRRDMAGFYPIESAYCAGFYAYLFESRVCGVGLYAGEVIEHPGADISVHYVIL